MPNYIAKVWNKIRLHGMNKRGFKALLHCSCVVTLLKLQCVRGATDSITQDD